MESAIDRVPIELWRDILEYALSSPLLPHRDDSILEAHTVLLQGCEADAVQLAHQRLIVACRLVSRAWDEIAQSIERRCLANYCDSGYSTSYPRYPWVLKSRPLRRDGTFEDWAVACSRLEILRYATWPSGNCRSERCFLRWKRPINIVSSASDTDRSATSESVALKVFISRERGDPCPILDRSPQLRAFSITFVSSPVKMQEVSRHPAIQRLTHLECRCYLEHFLIRFSAVSLRSLVYLCIYMPYSHSSSASWTSNMDGVNLPNLKHLYIFSHISPETMDDFSAFIRSSSARLTSLVWEDSSHTNQDWSRVCGFTTDFWEAIPHVVNLGIDPQILFINDRTQGITATASPPSTSEAVSQGLHLILPHTPSISSQRTDMATQIREMRYLIEHWNVYQVTLSKVKWKFLEAHIQSFRTGGSRANLGCLPCFAWFFNLMAEYGVRVLDADGEGIIQGAGRKYVETVAEVGFDYVGPDSSTWVK